MPDIGKGGERRVRQTEPHPCGGPSGCGCLVYDRTDTYGRPWAQKNERTGPADRRVAHERRKQADRALTIALKDGDTYLMQIVSGGILALRRPR